MPSFLSGLTVKPADPSKTPKDSSVVTLGSTLNLNVSVRYALCEESMRRTSMSCMPGEAQLSTCANLHLPSTRPAQLLSREKRTFPSISTSALLKVRPDSVCGALQPTSLMFPSPALRDRSMLIAFAPSLRIVVTSPLQSSDMRVKVHLPVEKGPKPSVQCR